MSWRDFCTLLLLWSFFLAEAACNNSTSNETVTTVGTTASFENTTEEITTTLDPFVELCQSTQVAYEVGKCYCQLDPCLDAVFELEDLDWCPTCSIQPPTTTPLAPSTTTFDWATLFTSTANGTIDNTTLAWNNSTNNPSTTTSATTTTTSVQTTTTTTTTTVTTSGLYLNDSTTHFGPDNTTISNSTTVSETILSNDTRCSLVPLGIQLSDLSTYTGGLCCCAEYKGERIHVALNVSGGDLQYGKYWTKALEDRRHPITNDLLKRLNQELAVLAKYAFKEKLIGFRFHGIRRVNFLYVGVTFTVTLPQSRWDNDVLVKAVLRRTIGQYNNMTIDRGIFNFTYTGYTKTRYDEMSIQTRRILDSDFLPKKIATQGSLVEDGDNETDIALVIMVIFGTIVLLALVVYILFFSRSCFCKSWFT
ncbi:hypothetical protein TCAL_01887 [Tigriopus californicus]|uniref:SEA domain-containing protein n=1 Tax=Tigriopus californicus TaxID=6832 RepID=A0A553P7K1_TIGCA|nr:uncharacterized protein LOC131877548 [Tigriopus californicus]TRY73662.1 hypothetical protein TCAL_01887 [Tigriopus californicus]|eukprot:TCALIF_01887-PA protein Name:"Protein of unknown function" AED:0.00 eAED:0.00 QI:39/1/1/1/0.75/0.8/5/65/420